MANVSHELRTPVHAMLLHAELLQESLTRRDVAASDHFAHALERNANRLGRIIDDLLFLSRQEAGRQPLELVSVSLARLCAAVVEPILPLARVPHSSAATKWARWRPAGGAEDVGHGYWCGGWGRVVRYGVNPSRSPW